MRAVTLLRWLLLPNTLITQLCTGAWCATGPWLGQRWTLYCDTPLRARCRVLVWHRNDVMYRSSQRARVRVVQCLMRAAYGVTHTLSPTDQQLAREWLASGSVDLRAWLSYQRLAAQYFQSKVPEQPPLPSSRCP